MIYPDVAAHDHLPLVRAKAVLGDRLLWLGTPAEIVEDADLDDALTCWSLDGETHATYGEVMRAAGLGEL